MLEIKKKNKKKTLQPKKESILNVWVMITWGFTQIARGQGSFLKIAMKFSRNYQPWIAIKIHFHSLEREVSFVQNFSYSRPSSLQFFTSFDLKGWEILRVWEKEIMKSRSQTAKKKFQSERRNHSRAAMIQIWTFSFLFLPIVLIFWCSWWYFFNTFMR